MTALVSLLFITMIPVDCKITNFVVERDELVNGQSSLVGKCTHRVDCCNLLWYTTNSVSDNNCHLSSSVYRYVKCKCYRQPVSTHTIFVR